MIKRAIQIFFAFLMLTATYYYLYKYQKIGSVKALSAQKIIPFDTILLIINYNHPYYQSRDFLEGIYKEPFPHQLFYGEKENPRINTLATHQGWFAHRVLADAMQRHPYYEGYLMIQDDCLVNYWNLARFDRHKIWINESIPRELSKVSHPWVWWAKECGASAVKDSIKSLSSGYLQQLERNCSPDTIVTGAADFVYIPARYRKEFILLSSIFDKTFIEIAIPTIAFCLDTKENIEFTHFLWDYSLNNDFDTSLDWIHPLKFSNIANQNLVQNYLKKIGV